MSGRLARGWAAAVALCAAAACAGGASSPVVGQWQRTDQPREWLRFEADGTFTGRGFTSDTTLVRGRYDQRGDTIHARSVQGYAGTLTVDDGVLVMQDGTRYRRVSGAR